MVVALLGPTMILIAICLRVVVAWRAVAGDGRWRGGWRLPWCHRRGRRAVGVV